MQVLIIAATEIAVNTAPFCSRLKLWLVVKTSGIAEKVRYRTAQLKEIQRLKKKTTDSVNSRWKGRYKLMPIILPRDVRSSSLLTFQRIRTDFVDPSL